MSAEKPNFLPMFPWYSGTSADMYRTVFGLVVSLKLFLGRFDIRTMQVHGSGAALPVLWSQLLSRTCAASYTLVFCAHCKTCSRVSFLGVCQHLNAQLLGRQSPLLFPCSSFYAR